MKVVPPFEQNFNYTYPRTICVQYQRILFSIFREEDFSKVCIKFANLKLSLVIILIIMVPQTLTFKMLREDVNRPKFTYPELLWAIHIGPNFKVKISYLH